MASFEERIYELGFGALAEQERQVGDTRGRGTPILASGAVIASLLAKPVFHSGHPHGWLEVSAAAAGLAGCAGVLLFVVLLLRPSEFGFSVKAAATYRSLWDQDILEPPGVDLVLAEALEERRDENAAAVNRLVLFLAFGARLAHPRDRWPGACGGGKLIAMADRGRKDHPTPAKPANVPKPGSLPKLPQTIFNLEKRGGSGNSTTRRTTSRPRPAGE